MSVFAMPTSTFDCASVVLQINASNRLVRVLILVVEENIFSLPACVHILQGILAWTAPQGLWRA